MSGKLPLVIEELLRYRESPQKFTKVFNKLKHNKHLCPAVERQTNRILDCFIKYHSIAYDVQGINDRGTDVVLRYYVHSESGDLDSRFTAFQVKSFDDLKSKDYLITLKAQCFEAQKEYGDSLDQYYILICTDKSVHKNKIRQIKKAFASSKNVTVIDPIYMATFLRLNPIRINSVVVTLLREDDIIYERASSDIEVFTPTEAAVYSAIVLETTFSSRLKFPIANIQENVFVKEIYSKVPDYPRDYYFYLEDVDFELYDNENGEDLSRSEIKDSDDRKRDFEQRFAEDIDTLDGGLFSVDASTGMMEVDLEYARAMQALMLDGMVRYDCREDALLTYVFSSLGVLERFGFDDLQEEQWPEELIA